MTEEKQNRPRKYEANFQAAKKKQPQNIKK